MSSVTLDHNMKSHWILVVIISEKLKKKFNLFPQVVTNVIGMVVSEYGGSGGGGHGGGGTVFLSGGGGSGCDHGSGGAGCGGGGGPVFVGGGGGGGVEQCSTVVEAVSSVVEETVFENQCATVSIM